MRRADHVHGALPDPSSRRTQIICCGDAVHALQVTFSAYLHPAPYSLPSFAAHLLPRWISGS